MCGIAGIAPLDPRRPVDAGPLPGMLQRLAHRGPDDEGVFGADGVTLGHRRLSVIDLDGGNQPLYGETESTVIVGAGEVYNYRELAAELEQRGHRFRTASDIEVAAHAYDAWGMGFLDRLDGMYALALWDGKARRLVLVRDRFGEKPLYFVVADGLLIFASELTGILAHPAVAAELNPRALSAYLALEYVPAPLSMIKDVRKLEPGTALVLEDGEVRHETYWTIEPTPRHPPLPYPDAVRRLRGLLDDAARSRLVSDVPLGIFLSGGIDSSTVAALAARHGALETFSIGFDEPSFDESRYARAVAQRIGCHHHERVLRGADMPELVPRLGSLLDEPIGDASIVPTTLLSAFAREKVTVALGGDGGDELFAGYPMHQAHKVAPVMRAFPTAVRRALEAGARRIPVTHGNFTLGFKLSTFLRGIEEAAPLNHALWMSSFAPEEQRRLLSPSFASPSELDAWAFASILRAWSESDGAPLLARARHLDARTYMSDDILTKVDRASMSVALEVRAPFLSRAVVEFAFDQPDAYHMRGLTGKRMLRDAVSDLLPRQVVRRPKKGFGIPVGAWLNGPLEPLVQDLLSADSLRREGLFQASEVHRRLREHAEKVRDHRKPLWTLLVFELWRREHLEKRRVSPTRVATTPARE